MFSDSSDDSKRSTENICPPLASLKKKRRVEPLRSRPKRNCLIFISSESSESE